MPNHADVYKIAPSLKEKFHPSLLGLPLELRRKIYRPLLSAYWVNKVVPNPAYHSSKIESEPIGNFSESEAFEVGTPRCQNIWKQTLEYAPAILVTCRQIHAEASAIFALENTWITVRVNKAGYGKALKERGFGVVYCGNVDRFPNPVLKVSIVFPSLQSQHEEDTFVMSPVSLLQLPRALWTTKGLEEMVLSLEVHRIFTARPADDEDDLLECFYQIRGLHKLILRGIQQKKYLRDMPSALQAPYKDGNEILKDLRQALLAFKYAHRHKNWEALANRVEASFAFLADCYKIYGSQFVNGKGETYKEICKTIIDLAAGIAQLRLRVGEYDSVIKYATLAQTIMPIAPHSKVDLLIMRGEAYEALGQDVKLMKDLLEAQKLMPENKTVTAELGKLKKRLDPHPMKALAAFKDMRALVEKQLVEERDTLNTLLDGKVKNYSLSDGRLVVGYQL